MPDEFSGWAQLGAHEHVALRIAVAHRGQLRAGIFVAGIAAWAALLLAVVATSAVPALALLPLLVLAAAFEAVHQLHVGAERIGRFLRVFYETGLPGAPCWETAVGSFGAPLAGSGTDPLFVTVFATATIVNLLALLVPGPTVQESVVVGAVHAVLIGRMVSAKRAAGRQRADDERRFRQIKDSGLRPS